MNRSIKIISLAILIIVQVKTLSAQDEYLHCGSAEATQRSLDAHPQLKQKFEQEQERLKQLDEKAYASNYKQGNNKSLPVYIIPVVFHVIHEGGIENISDEQIHDEVRILNRDYRKLNADTSDIVSQLKSRAADCSIEFRLAQLDPYGNCTNGIDRIYAAETNNADDNSKLNPWPVDQYLNVWTVKTIGQAGVAGYAYFPGTAFPAEADGVLILSDYIGSIGTGTPTTSRALTHEIGHYLSLYHTWGGTNSPGVDCSGTDYVSDTPKTKGWTTCNLSGATCSSPVDNVQNYMEYSYCSRMFTAGQRTRMRNTLMSGVGSRDNLWSPNNLSLTGVSLPAALCTADFKSDNSTNTICQGDSLTFTDLSWNGHPTNWTWTCNGGTPSISHDSMPVIHYNTPGTYPVSLSVSNSTGTVNTTKTNYVNVYPSTAMYSNAFFSESFESSAIPNADWHVNNTDNGTSAWSQTSAAASSGTKSVSLLNTAANDGAIDELISPSIDMTAIAGTTPTLTFKVAYAQRTSASNDKLQIYVSTNCGQIWSLRKTIIGPSLSTGGIKTTGFVPTTNQWALQSVNLSGYSNQNDLFMMFRFTSNGGNNIYLDDINITGTTNVADEISNNIDFKIYPNPAEENTVVTFNTLTKQKVDLRIYDIIGREVKLIVDGELNAGEHIYSIISGEEKFAPGAYFVKLSVGGSLFTKQLIVK